MEFDGQDIETLKQEIRLSKASALEQLNLFSINQATKWQGKLVEKEKLAISSKDKAEESKAAVLFVLEWFLLCKLAENRIGLFVMEKIKHEKHMEKLKEEYENQQAEVSQTLNEKLEQINLNDCEREEIIRSLNCDVLRRLCEEEMTQAKESIETKLREKYINFLLPLKLSELKEDYNIQMSEKSKVWKKQAYEINSQIGKRISERNKRAQLYKNQRTLECMLRNETNWRKKAKQEIKDLNLRLNSLQHTIKKKHQELYVLKVANQVLGKQTGHWNKIVPEVLRQMEMFVDEKFENITECSAMKEAINELRKCQYQSLNVVAETEMERKIEKASDEENSKELNLTDLICEKEQCEEESKSSWKENAMFEVQGAKYSIPDIQNPEIFIRKRIQSLENIKKIC